MDFICKFEMHPFTQVGCIVSICGTQASWDTPGRSRHIGLDFPHFLPSPAGHSPPAPDLLYPSKHPSRWDMDLLPE